MKVSACFPFFIHKKRRRSFTLVEILVVLAIITTLAGTVPLTLNYTGQMNKALDTRRKTDLGTLSKALEDYQNDNQSYPLDPALCFDTPQAHGDIGYNTCVVCGRELAKQSFPPYLNQLPCDPQYAARNYLYVYDTNAGTGSSKYVLCARLSTISGTDGYYNYGVASSDVNPDICKTIALSGANGAAPTSPVPTNTPVIIATATVTPIPPTTTNTPIPTTPTPKTLYATSKIIGQLVYTSFFSSSPYTAYPSPSTPKGTFVLNPSNPAQASMSCQIRYYAKNHWMPLRCKWCQPSGWDLVYYYYYDCTATFSYLEGTSPSCQTVTSSPATFNFTKKPRSICPNTNYGLLQGSYANYPYWGIEAGISGSYFYSTKDHPYGDPSYFDSNWNIDYSGN